jgi:hypothetical protein
VCDLLALFGLLVEKAEHRRLFSAPLLVGHLAYRKGGGGMGDAERPSSSGLLCQRGPCVCDITRLSKTIAPS